MHHRCALSLARSPSALAGGGGHRDDQATRNSLPFG